MYKELLAAGIYAPPYAPLPQELLQELREKVNVIEPSPGQLQARHDMEHTDGLTVYFAPTQGQRYWFYDNEGFLCSTSSVQVMVALIEAEGRPRPNPKQPALKNGARELLYPGSAHKSQERLVSLQENARLMRERMQAKRADGPAGSAGSGTELNLANGEQILLTLGLDDGKTS